MRVNELCKELVLYSEDMNLPALDKRGILRYVGLSDHMVDWAFYKYKKANSSYPDDLAGSFRNIIGNIAYEGYKFPLIRRFNHVLMKRNIDDLDEVDINYGELLHWQSSRYFYSKTFQEHTNNIMKEWLAWASCPVGPEAQAKRSKIGKKGWTRIIRE